MAISVNSSESTCVAVSPVPTSDIHTFRRQ
jgi:hypothetical protein